MPNTQPDHTDSGKGGIVRWIVPTVAAAVVAGAVLTYGRSTEHHAAAGSPYYDKAVREAIRGLLNPGGRPARAEGIPPLPEGLSPDEHYWCENCKTYHKRAPGQQPAAAATPPPAAAAETPAAIPPLPEGASADDYYWCPNCKAYHARQPAEAEAPAGWRGVPYSVPPPAGH